MKKKPRPFSFQQIIDFFPLKNVRISSPSDFAFQFLAKSMNYGVSCSSHAKKCYLSAIISQTVLLFLCHRIKPQTWCRDPECTHNVHPQYSVSFSSVVFFMTGTTRYIKLLSGCRLFTHIIALDRKLQLVKPK